MNLQNELENAYEILSRDFSGFLAMLPKAGVALVVLFVFYAVGKGIQRGVTQGFEKAGKGGSGALIVGKLAYYGVVVVGVLVAMSIAIPNFEFGTLVGTLGLGSVAIGFAFKEVFENFISGIYLLISRPFKIGDVIRIGDVTGTVLEIETRATLIQKFDREMVVMPSSRLFKEEVTVVSRNPVRRIELSVGVAYGSDLGHVRRVVEDAVVDVPGVADDPPVLVTFHTFGDSSIDLTVYFFSDLSEFDARIVRNDVLMAIEQAFEAAKIEIPYPHQVHVEGPRREPTPSGTLD